MGFIIQDTEYYAWVKIPATETVTSHIPKTPTAISWNLTVPNINSVKYIMYAPDSIKVALANNVVNALQPGFAGVLYEE